MTHKNHLRTKTTTVAAKWQQMTRKANRYDEQNMSNDHTMGLVVPICSAPLDDDDDDDGRCIKPSSSRFQFVIFVSPR